MSGSEADLKRQVLRYLKSRGGWCYKSADKFTAGIPDILYIENGKHYFFELKKLGGKLSKLQLYTIGMINTAGGNAYVAYSLDDVKSKLKGG